jgi:hypothetical protein
MALKEETKCKSKCPKKGEYDEQNERTHLQEDKRITYKGKPQGEHHVPKPLFVMRSISNKERGGLLARRFSLEDLSSIAIACLKIEIVYAHYKCH